MSFNQFRKSADAMVKLIEDSEKVALPIFANKLAQASEVFPEDHTIGAFASVIAKMASNKKMFITRGEIKDLYNKLHTRNNKFSELFSAELGEVAKLATPTIYNREGDDEAGSIISKSYEKLVDPALANALNSAFGNKVKTFTNVSAESARAVCEQDFKSLNLTAKIEVSNGSEDVIVCRATFETPKGQVSVFVPVELIANKALFPSLFVGNDGPVELTKCNVEEYISSNAGKKLAITDTLVLAAVANTKNGDVSSVSGVDFAITKLNAAKETVADSSEGQILFQKLNPEAKKDVKTPLYSDPDVATFAAQFETSNGIANFKFGKDAVNTAKLVIEQNLNSFGMNNAQISVLDATEDSVVYAVSINAGQTAFRVPVKMNGNYLPTVLISNGTMRDFSKQSIYELFQNAATDNNAAAHASPLFDLRASELIEFIGHSVETQNYAQAEEALNVLASLNDEKAYQTALSVYANGLNGVKQAETKCSRVVKNASSQHELCGHTGLPTHKVYQDKNGNCIPKYRKDMSDTYEGASFMNSKIFF